jgi:hypothetical protein
VRVGDGPNWINSNDYILLQRPPEPDNRDIAPSAARYTFFTSSYAYSSSSSSVNQEDPTRFVGREGASTEHCVMLDWIYSLWPLYFSQIQSTSSSISRDDKNALKADQHNLLTIRQQLQMISGDGEGAETKKAN